MSYRFFSRLIICGPKYSSWKHVTERNLGRLKLWKKCIQLSQIKLYLVLALYTYDHFRQPIPPKVIYFVVDKIMGIKFHFRPSKNNSNAKCTFFINQIPKHSNTKKMISCNFSSKFAQKIGFQLDIERACFYTQRNISFLGKEFAVLVTFVVQLNISQLLYIIALLLV